ncbi:MAG: glycosyltransferase [Candidatus Sericytochromatia bacterium]
MQNNPRLTIALPIYNAEKYLRIALDSILAQDFKDYQVIIFDNCSEDSTPEICREYTSKDSRFKYHKNEVNIGAIKNFNNAVSFANTEFFVWLAHDDGWEPSFLSKCIKKLDETPEAVLCCTGTNYIDADGNIVKEMQSLDRGEGFETLGLDYKQRISAMWSKSCWEIIYGVYRSNFIKNTNLLSYSYGPDVCFLLSLLITDNIICVKERLFNYRFIIKSIEQYQSCFFSNNKHIEKPMTENYSSIFEYIFNLNIPNDLKFEASEYLMQLLSTSSDRYKIFNENIDIQEFQLLKSLILIPSLENNFKKQLLFNNIDNKKDFSFIDSKEELEEIEELISKGKFRVANTLINSLDKDYKLPIKIKVIWSYVLFKIGNIRQSLLLIDSILFENKDNEILLNNKAVVLLKNNNYVEAFSIFKNLALKTNKKEIIYNCLRFFNFLEEYDLFQKIKNLDLNTKVFYTKIIVDKVYNNKTVNNGKNEPIVSIIIINNEKNNSLKEQLFELSLQSINNFIEIIVISNKKDTVEENINDLIIKNVYCDMSINNNLIKTINNVIKLSNGKYITICQENQRYKHNYFEEAVKFFSSQDEIISACYPNVYSSKEYVSDNAVSFSEWNRELFISSLLLNFCPPFIWKKSIHNLYGYFDENLTKFSIIEFFIRISQTHKVINSNIYSGYFNFEKDLSDDFKTEYSHVSKKYLEAEKNNEIILLNKKIEPLEFFWLDFNFTNIDNFNDFSFYIIDDNFKNFKIDNSYLIFCQNVNISEFNYNDIISLNKTYDQIWVKNESIKNEYIESGINKNRIKVLSNISENELKNNILELNEKNILRLNIESFKEELINKGFKYFNNLDYKNAENCFYELSRVYMDPNYFYNLGLCQYHQNDFDNALESLSTSLELGLSSYELYILIAKVSEKMGDLETAKEFYNKSKEF